MHKYFKVLFDAFYHANIRVKSQESSLVQIRLGKVRSSLPNSKETESCMLEFTNILKLHIATFVIFFLSYKYTSYISEMVPVQRKHDR